MTKSKTNPRRIDDLELSDEERFGLRKGMDAACNGQFAPDDEMEEFYQLHRKA